MSFFAEPLLVLKRNQKKLLPVWRFPQLWDKPNVCHGPFAQSVWFSHPGPHLSEHWIGLRTTTLWGVPFHGHGWFREQHACMMNNPIRSEHKSVVSCKMLRKKKYLPGDRLVACPLPRKGVRVVQNVLITCHGNWVDTSDNQHYVLSMSHFDHDLCWWLIMILTHVDYVLCWTLLNLSVWVRLAMTVADFDQGLSWLCVFCVDDWLFFPCWLVWSWLCLV